MTFPRKPNISLSNLTVAEKIWLTVFLNAIVMPPNISEHGTLLKEWRDNNVSSIQMGLFLSYAFC